MDDLAYIVGLMAENTDALGFVPSTTVEARYLALGRYIIQHDMRGRRTGYVLHGKPTPGGLLTIAQAVIDYDYRNHGQGREVVECLLDRAQRSNVRAIKLQCADDLDANAFWLALGFTHTNTILRKNRRDRAINVYMLDLWPRLLE